MSIPKKIFSESFKIRSSEIRPDGKAKLQTICDLLQEIAGNHALQLNFDITQLQQTNRTWVLHRLNMVISRYPEWREVVTVQTWPSGGAKLYAYRDFLLKDQNDTILARALSYWLMIDLDNRRPVRIPNKVLVMSPEDAEHVIPLKTSQPVPPKSSQTEKIFSVRFSDLDVNRHVNNIKYVEWIAETLPNDRLPCSIDIEFKAECRYGKEITAISGPIHNNCVQSSISMKDEQKLLATAEINFL